MLTLFAPSPMTVINRKKGEMGRYKDKVDRYGSARRIALFSLLLVVASVRLSLVAVAVFPSNASRSDTSIIDLNGIIQRNASDIIPSHLLNIDTKLVKESQSIFPVSIYGTDPEKVMSAQTKLNEHASSLFETIDHPGMFFAGIERLKVLLPDADNIPRTLDVPKFWNPPEYGPRGVRSVLGNHGRRLMTQQEAHTVGSIDPVSGQETIFISLASYRDPECAPTLESIFTRAKHPQRVRVGVVDQIDITDGDNVCNQPEIPCEEDPLQVLCRYNHLIDVYQVPAYLMVGPVLARHIAHRMYRGEYYTMQVDAHVRFVEGWDDDIISQWKSTKNEMAVLSTYLTDIEGSIDPKTHKSLRRDHNVMCDIQYDGTGSQRRLTLKHPTKRLEKEAQYGSPTLHPFWSAGFSFARGHFTVQVPYDQYLPMIFQGEESSIAVRGFTYGYDYYAPERSVTFHIYAMKRNIGRRSRHKFWENETLYRGALEKSTARMNGITGLVPDNRKWLRSHNTAGTTIGPSYFNVDEDKYGIGQVRPREQYFRVFGIDPELGKVQATLCDFVRETMTPLFSTHLRSDGMGIDYNMIEIIPSII
jgi:[Skp1-protein]-hydroxyproline N-acetylglucosaminyltransferase